MLQYEKNLNCSLRKLASLIPYISNHLPTMQRFFKENVNEQHG